jgi:hypothetical protein
VVRCTINIMKSHSTKENFIMSKEMWDRLCEEKERQWQELMASMTDKEKEHFFEGYNHPFDGENE